jgi:hypothetical protein
MNFWINLWTLFFLLSLALFGALAVIVTIGGFFDIRSLFKSLTAGASQEDKKPSTIISEQSRKDRKGKPKR